MTELNGNKCIQNYGRRDEKLICIRHRLTFVTIISIAAILIIWQTQFNNMQRLFDTIGSLAGGASGNSEQNGDALRLNDGFHKCFRVTWNKTGLNGFLKSKDITENINTSSSDQNIFCNRFIEHSGHMGRTGNQLFQIAAVFGVAFEYDYIPIVSPSLPLLKYFDLPNVFELNLTNSVACIQSLPTVYYMFLNGNETSQVQNITLDGYLQSWKYFKKAEKAIRAIFKIKYQYLNAAKLFIRNNVQRGYKNICIHVRRGDMATKENQKRGYQVVDAGFIYRAILYYELKYKNPNFLVLSNDIIWCKVNIKHEHITFSNFKDPGYDLAVMTLCDHVVVTSGTFGWWGAWLSNGSAVYFKGFPRPGSERDLGFMREDYYPPQWIGFM